MTVMVGIHQQQEDNTMYEPQSKNIQSLLSVGPFASRDEAQQWQQYMLRRSGGETTLLECTSEGKQSLWFGYITEA